MQWSEDIAGAQGIKDSDKGHHTLGATQMATIVLAHGKDFLGYLFC
jgi:hypothetical protein